MKPLFFFVIIALGCVHALPTAEPAPLPVAGPPLPAPERTSNNGGGDDGPCNPRNNGTWDMIVTDLTNTILYNPCGSNGVFTTGKEVIREYLFVSLLL